MAFMEQAAAALAATAAATAHNSGLAVEGGGAGAAEARWEYILRLAGGLYCQGLLHTPALVGWLLGKGALLSLRAQVQLLPLLHLTLRVSLAGQVVLAERLAPQGFSLCYLPRCNIEGVPQATGW